MIVYRPLVAILTAGLLAISPACGDPRPVAPAPDADPRAPAATIEETTAALERGPLSYPPDAWTQNIDGWLDRLESAEIAHRDEIVDALQELRTEVQRTPLDMDRLASLLDRLGSFTIGAGTQAGDARAEHLGQLLNREADRLRAELAAPPGLPPRTMRPGAPGAAESEGATPRPDRLPELD